MTTLTKTKPATLAPEAISIAAEAAIRRIAPLWPLKHFVAVNPFLGFTAQPFTEAATEIARTTGDRITATRAEYAALIAAGHITDADLKVAASKTLTADALKAAAFTPSAMPDRLPTVAEIAASQQNLAWPRILLDHCGAFAARHFDNSEATWVGPVESLGLWDDFKFEQRHDRTLELIGLPGLRSFIAALPDDAAAAIQTLTATLGLSEAGLASYYHRLLADLPGWAGHARYRLWQAELAGKTDTALTELLAVRLAYEAALLQTLPAPAEWEAAKAEIAAPAVPSQALIIDAALQRAQEHAYQRQLIEKLENQITPEMLGQAPARPDVQAVFCIDVRSEPFRRAFERQSPGIETMGFAGFFGLAIDYVRMGQKEALAHCPVLLAPGLTIHEHVHGASEDESESILIDTQIARRTKGALASFKRAAVAGFAYVETLGPLYAFKLVTDSLGITRPAPRPSHSGLAESTASRLAPDISELDIDTMAGAGEAILRAMSMVGPFAPLVLFAGHGSTSLNNPHATGLDCGACGGHDGAPNARVAAGILNVPAVRARLAEKGITIPADTWFLAGLHDTTTDDLKIYDEMLVPAARTADLAKLKAHLAATRTAARLERAPSLGLAADTDINANIERRANDWAQVRPEWGLANCAAFIAAPRHRTKGINLEGRSFLHSYDHAEDAKNGYPVLNLIMVAPMVVASWISLQYYGSALDPHTLGAGNKLLHNAVGSLGVLEGYGGDLRPGLPFQSVHNGEKSMHEPLRLSVIIEAPTSAMDAVIAANQGVHDLISNEWLYLFAMDAGGKLHRWLSPGTWA